MKHDDVHKFVARSEDEWRAHISAAIEAARVPWARGGRDVVEPDDDDELEEGASRSGTLRARSSKAGRSLPAASDTEISVPRRQRKRSLSKVLEAARRAGADRVIVDGVVIALSPAAAVAVPESDANEWDTVLQESDHGPH
jgi:hypothetical protein